MADKPIIFSAPMVRALLDGRKTQTRRVLTKRNTLFDGTKWPNYMFDCQFHWDRAWVDTGPSPAGNPGPYLKLPVTNIEMVSDGADETVHRIYPRVQPGDRLYVREAWRAMDGQDKFSGSQIAAQCLEAGYKRAWSPIQYEVDGARDNWIADPHTFGSTPGRYRHARFMPRWASRLTLTVTDVRVQRLQDISEADARAEGCDPHKMGTARNPYKDDFRAGFSDLWNSLHGPDAWDANPWVCATSFTVQRGNIDQMPGAM